MRKSPPLATARRGTAEATRARLIDAGRRAFARKGLAGTKLTQDILEPARVSVGSFYHQFKDKTDLMLAIFEEQGDNLRAIMRDAYRQGPGRSLAEIARESYELTFSMADKYANFMRILIRERGADDLRVKRFIDEDRRRWVESLKQEYRRLAELHRFDLDVELAAELIAALTFGVIDRYLELPEPERPAARERLLDGLVRLTLGGLPALSTSVAVPASAPSSATEWGDDRAD
jgi:AcrR family transcriptional regulator